VAGGDVGEDTGGYHFYPSDQQVSERLGAAGLEVVQDVVDMSSGEWGYRHLLLRIRLGSAFGFVGRTVIG